MPHEGTDTFEQEVRDAVAPILTEINEARTAIDKQHAELMKRWEQGDAPDAPEVLAQEGEKVDLEGALRDLTRELQTETRRRMEIKPAREQIKDVFKGAFIADVEQVRHAFRTQSPNHAQEALNRALTSGTTLSSAGALNADQEDQFLDWLVEQQQALMRVNRRRMTANTAYLDELVTGTRKLRAATEATGPSVADGFSTGRRSLTSVETIWAEDISYSFIEDNIERGDIESHIARNLATGFGNDHNDLFWNGDEDNSDAFLGINDGIIDIAKADGSVNDSDATSVTTWTAVFNAALQLMPYQFQALGDHAFWIPFKGIFAYADELADRATALGDSVLVDGRSALRYFGIPVVGEPHLDAGDEAVLTPTRNLVWGVQRGITFESERNPRKRVMEYTITARTDQNYSKSTAVVLIDGLESSLTD